MSAVGGTFHRVALAVSLLATLACGCGGSRQSGADSRASAPNPNAKPVDASTAGSVTGTIHFEGNAPPPKTINMAAVPVCAKQRTSPATTEEVVVGDNGTLQNVVVYLKGDFSAYSFPRSADPVKVDQNGCIYQPHVAALMTGESLQISNSDAATHNVNAVAKRNRGWNETQAPGSSAFSQQFTREEVAVRVKCNVHPWMRMYVAVIGNPYFQVTGKDGSFTLKNVPPGTYTLSAWHEAYGVKEQTITIAPNQQLSASLTFNDHDRP